MAKGEKDFENALRPLSFGLNSGRRIAGMLARSVMKPAGMPYVRPEIDVYRSVVSTTHSPDLCARRSSGPSNPSLVCMAVDLDSVGSDCQSGSISSNGAGVLRQPTVTRYGVIGALGYSAAGQSQHQYRCADERCNRFHGYDFLSSSKCGPSLNDRQSPPQTIGTPCALAARFIAPAILW